MNILYLCDEYPPGQHGGIGTVVQTLAREMVKQGHNVVVAGMYDWGYGGEDVFVDEGVKVYRFRHSLASSFFHNQSSLAVRISYRILRTLGILQWDIEKSIVRYKDFLEDLIAEYAIEIVEMPDYNDYIRHCKKEVFFPELSVPVVVKLHGNMTYFNREAGGREQEHVYNMELAIFKKASNICSVSKYTAGKTRAYFGLQQPIHVIHNGINTDVAIGSASTIPNRVIFSGTLVEKKGIYQLMEAWNIVSAKNDAHLYVYGKGNTEKIKARLTPDAVNSVVFMGHTDRRTLMNEISRSSVCIFPSYAEAFSLAPMEAMACGVCVIFTRRTSGPELITDGVDGLLVDPDDIPEIAEKICYVLTHDDVRLKLASNGQQTVREKFDLRIIAMQNLAFYQEVIDQKNA